MQLFKTVECIAVKTGIAVAKRFAYKHMHTFVRSLAVGRLINSPGHIAVTGHRLSHASLIDRCFQNVMHFTFTFVQPAVAPLRIQYVVFAGVCDNLPY